MTFGVEELDVVIVRIWFILCRFLLVSSVVVGVVLVRFGLWLG